MSYRSTNFLRATVLLIGAVVLGLCLFALPAGIARPVLAVYRPILFGLYVTAIPFFIALFHTIKLLDHIDSGQAFSHLSVDALKHIKRSAVIIAGLFGLGFPYIYFAADQDDAPGVILIGLVITFASVVVAVFAAVLQRLLQSAIDIKTENDLTV